MPDERKLCLYLHIWGPSKIVLRLGAKGEKNRKGRKK